MHGRLGIAFIALVVGCVDSATITCGDRTCPASHVCIRGSRCVSMAAVEACDAKADNEPCNAGGAAGTCSDGVCDVVVCGNGEIDPGEACDDGNLEGGDGCSSTCRSDETCGNGVIDPGEGCDCGDGTAEHANAACAMANSDVPTATCRTDCTPHSCGDGAIEGGEQCEVGMLNGATCITRGFYEGTLGCDDVCRYDTSQCAKYCGDKVINGPEACDGAAPAETCLAFGFDGGAIACSDLCRPAFDACRSIGWIEHTLDNRLFYAVSGTSETDVWAAGEAGALLHWDGVEWKSSTLAGPSLFSGIWGAAPNAFFAVGDDDVYKFDGNAWSMVATAADNLYAVSGFGTGLVIAVGANGVIHSWNGAAWAPMTSGTAMQLHAVQVLSATDAYAAGGDDPDAVLLHWNGAVWSPLAAPPVGEITAMWVRSANDIYIGGRGLQHWDGVRWTGIPLAMSASITSITGTATDVFVATGASGSPIAHFDGSSWFLHDTSTVSARQGLWAAPGGGVFTAGLRVTRYAGSGWSIQRPNRPSTLYAVGGEAGSVLAAGDAGHVLRFDGVFWESVPSELGAQILGVSGPFVVGEAGALGRFDGQRIVALPSGTTTDFWAVWAASATEAWAIGDVSLHIDGGNITVVDPANGTAPIAVWGFAPDDVFVVGAGGLMRRWNGATWSTFASGTTVNLRGIWGSAADNLFVVGDGGVVRRWNGSGWQDLGAPSTDQLTDVFGISATEIYVAQRTTQKLLKWTQSGGWSTEPLAQPVSHVGGVGTAVFAVGNGGALWSGPGPWTSQIPTFTSTNQTIDTRSLYAAAPFDIYAVANDLLHFDGFLWTNVTVPITAGPRDVAGTGAGDVWVLSYANQAAHWDGSAWRVDALAGSGSIRAVAAGSPSVAFGVGDGGRISRYNGVQWVAETPVTAQTLSDVWTSATAAFAVGSGGVVLQWNGSGWSAMTTPIPATTELYAVWAASDTDVFVAGDGLIARWQSGTWTVTQTPGNVVNALHGTAANDVFAVGAGGVVMRFDGQRWSPIRSRTTSPWFSITRVGTKMLLGGRAPTFAIAGLRRDVTW